MSEKKDVPRWKEDFPIDWEGDDYVTRRDLAKFLTLGSSLLAGMSAMVAAVGRWFWRPTVDGPKALIGMASQIPANGSVLFRYPTAEDPCILVRSKDGELRAFSQVCTHLSCAVVHRPERDAVFCPCHHGWFDARTGLASGGPPTRPLPRVRLQVVDDEVFAVGKEV